MSISYHTFPVLSSVLDNFFGKIFRSFFIHQFCIIVDTHQVRWFVILLPGSSLVKGVRHIKISQCLVEKMGGRSVVTKIKRIRGGVPSKEGGLGR